LSCSAGSSWSVFWSPTERRVLHSRSGALLTQYGKDKLKFEFDCGAVIISKN
jgi:hypothetical protein